MEATRVLPTEESAESLGCLVCGGSVSAGVMTASGVAFLRCNDCDSLFRAETPLEPLMRQWYGRSYRSNGTRFIALADRVRQFMWRSAARRIKHQIMSVADRGQSIIDVGAGDGALAAELQRRGFDVLAIDPYSDAPGLIKRRLRDINVDRRLDAVVYWNSLEHVESLRCELAVVSELLALGGVLIAAVPNPASIQAGVGGRDWYGFDEGRHVTILSPDGWDIELKRAGFVPVPSVWTLGDLAQTFAGWLDLILRLLLRRVGFVQIFETGRCRPLVRYPAYLVVAAAAPLAACLAFAESLLGRPGSMVVVAKPMQPESGPAAG